MKKLIFLFLLFSILIVQCERQVDNPVQEEITGKLSMTMSLSSAPSEVNSIGGYLSRASYDTIFFNFTIINNTGTALVENIIHGSWKLTVNAYDNSGMIIYTGSTDLEIIPGVITPVSLHLNPTTGSLEITVTWGTQNNLDSLLIAYYPFNGDAQDLSGNGNNGTVYGAVLTSDRWGNPNSAYSFDGVDDFIDIGNNEILKPDFPITICAWVNLNTYGAGHPIFTNNFNHDLYFGFWLNFTVDGLPAINYGNSGVIGPQSRFTKIGTTHLSLNTWYHIVGIIHDNSNMDLYVNGINDGGSYVGQATQMVYSEGSGNIGRIDASIHNPPKYIAGSVDEIYFYGRALTESEINSLAK